MFAVFWQSWRFKKCLEKMTINLLLFAPIIQLNLLWVETIHFKFAQFIVPVSALTLRFCNIYFVLCANFLKRKVNIWKPQIPDKIKDKSLTGFLGKKVTTFLLLLIPACTTLWLILVKTKSCHKNEHSSDRNVSG